MVQSSRALVDFIYQPVIIIFKNVYKILLQKYNRREYCYN